jgi:hypothetical protein
MKSLWSAALFCTIVGLGGQSSPTAEAHSGAAARQPLLRVRGRIDSLLASISSPFSMALVGQPGSRLPFLPHDRVVLFNPAGKTESLALPTYETAPGLAGEGLDRRAYLLVDSTLLTIDSATGRLLARDPLAAQAIGWPAAIAADAWGNIYFVGQPAGTMAAQAYAVSSGGGARPRPRWRASLGLTHAGTWIGLAGDRQVAVYVPDQHDAAGTIFLLDRERGTLRRSYAVPMPPSASDVSGTKLFLVGTGRVESRDLRSGALGASTRGEAPLAASSAAGLVAFARGNNVVVANSSTLQPVTVFAAPEGVPPTALAWQGRDLLLGNAEGLIARVPIP